MTTLGGMAQEFLSREAMSAELHNRILAQVLAVKILKEAGFPIRLIADLLGISPTYAQKMSVFTLE